MFKNLKFDTLDPGSIFLSGSGCHRVSGISGYPGRHPAVSYYMQTGTHMDPFVHTNN